MRRIAVLVLLVMLVGCGRQVIWLPKDLNGINAVEMERICLWESENTLPRTVINWGFESARYYNECMESKGFHKTYGPIPPLI